MEERGWGIPVEDPAKERGGGHGAIERAHAGRTAIGASPLGKEAPTLEHIGVGH
jgi:hypothetical protein